MQRRLQQLPAVHKLIGLPPLVELANAYGTTAVTAAVRYVLDQARAAIRADGGVPDEAELVARTVERLGQQGPPFKKVLNATGVLLHTNLGRAPLAASATTAALVASGYCDLELDLTRGVRASRHRYVAPALAALCGAEAALVVNNNAAAVLLALAGIAKSRPTAISRGQLVEIGGGFRLPSIIAASGSALYEVGTTNRTHLADYEQALADGVALVLVVHRSNFVMRGFVSEPGTKEIIAAAHASGVPTVLDLGSGAVLDTVHYGLPHELTVGEAVAQGFDIVCFSADKLFGGPQAGVLVGRQALIDELAHHPLARALRCDKMQLAALTATVDAYQRGVAEQQLPLWQALSAAPAQLRQRAEAWRDAIGHGEVWEVNDAVGGGALPEAELASAALSLDASNLEQLLGKLRAGDPAVLAHIKGEAVLLHPRCIDPKDDPLLVAAVRKALA